jgi:oxazoline/thiazoline dehydrogenase
VNTPVNKTTLATSTVLLALRADVALDFGNPNAVSVMTSESPPISIPLAPGLRRVIEQLREGGCSERGLVDDLSNREGHMQILHLYRVLGILTHYGLVDRTLVVDHERFATLIPRTHRFAQPNLSVSNTNGRWRLSRFAALRPARDGMSIGAPTGQAELIAHQDAAMTLVTAFAKGRSIDEIVAHASYQHLDDHTIRIYVAWLCACGVLVRENDSIPEASAETAAEGWEYHDLLFHSRSRLGRHHDAYGGVFAEQAGDACRAPPARKLPMSSDRIVLNKPDLQLLRAQDTSLTDVLERRRSVRDYGAKPIAVEQVAEFLYRVGHIQQVIHDKQHDMELMFKPTPNGGAIHELELYPVIGACDGLNRGLYQYDAFDHCLYRLPDSRYVEGLLGSAWLMANRTAPVQVCIVIAARMPRVQHKYRSVAYSLVLKHVGVLYQTMYLVATAMGLAPCALGGGDSDVFAGATGLDYYEETSVGEFLLGSHA